MRDKARDHTFDVRRQTDVTWTRSRRRRGHGHGNQRYKYPHPAPVSILSSSQQRTITPDNTASLPTTTPPKPPHSPKNPPPKPTNANMQFTILAFAAMAAAIPAMIQERAPGSVCPALDTPLCCQADVDGVVDVTCEARKYPPSYILELTQTLIFFSFRQLPTPPPSTPSRAAVPRAAPQPSAALCLWYVPLFLRNPFIRQNTCTDNINPRRLVMLFSAAPHKCIMYGATGEHPTNPFFFMNEI